MVLGARDSTSEDPEASARLLVSLLDRKAEFEKNQLGRKSGLMVFGSSMRSIVGTINAIANTDAIILITGETGVGKQLIAKAIHDVSDRGNKPFVTIDCANLKSDTAETQLFGHKRGSFTSAINDAVGFFQHAKDGTVFIDEISELPHELQGRFLRVLDDNKAVRLGDVEEYTVKARFIAATNRDLKKMVDKGLFRADLYHRLNVISIKVPPLRKRQEEIPILAEYFLIDLNIKYSGNVQFTPEALEVLRCHDWRGNVRELRNLLKRVFLLRSNPRLIQASDIKFEDEAETEESIDKTEGKDEGCAVRTTVTQNEETSGILKDVARRAKRKVESEVILIKLQEHKWNRRKAAIALGISYKSLLCKVRDYGLMRKDP